jgi:hypothetical protein
MEDKKDRFKNLGFALEYNFPFPSGRTYYRNEKTDLTIQFNEINSEIEDMYYNINTDLNGLDLKNLLHYLSVIEDNLLAQGYVFSKAYKFAEKASTKRNRSEHNRPTSCDGRLSQLPRNKSGYRRSKPQWKKR